MDGRNRIRLISIRPCIAAWSALVLALLIGGQVAADAPPLLELQGVPQPINRPLTTRVQIEGSRPGKHSVIRPLLHKPRGRVLTVSQTPVTAVLAGTGDSNTDVPARISAPVALQPANVRTTTAAQQAPATRMTVEEALQTKGSITFRKTSLSEVVFLLSDLWHINIVAGENVNGEVSGAFHDAPLQEVLSASLAATGYSYRQTGSSLVVLPIDQVGADDPTFVSDTIQLPSKLSNDDATLEAAQLLLSDRGQIRKVGDHTVLVVDTAQRIARVRQLFADLNPSPSQASVDAASRGQAASDQTLPGIASSSTVVQSGIAYFTPQFTEAEEMGEPLREALGESVIVAIYPEENRLMIKGAADDLRLAAEAIRQLDRPRPQVRITAMIYDVSLKEVERLGVDWSVRPHSSSLALSDLNDPESLRFRNIFDAATGLITDPSAPGTARFAVSSINSNIDVDSLLQALDGSSEAKLLADPSVSVGDRHQASIRLVQKIPIVAANPVENSSVVFTQVQFEEAGIILNVLPRISRDGTIEMKVQPEYSVVVDFIDNNPVIDSRTAETTVRVGNGQTFVLGGLRQKSIVESTRGVPYLQDLKYVGKFFRAHDTEVRESELIVFLRPEVTTPFDPGSLREQEAAHVATTQLDAIPYAETLPMTPCCKDCNCPNHFPRPRINGGSRWLEMMGGSGIHSAEQFDGKFIENIGPPRETVEGYSQDTISPQSASDRWPNVVIREVFPPIQIDRRAPQ